MESQTGHNSTYLPFIPLLLLDSGTSGSPTSYRLTVTKTGTGIGTVSVSPGALSWTGSTGTTVYSTGTVVTLTASATAGSSFAGWSGSCSGTGPCVLTMNGTKNVTATFSGSGSVSGMISVPAGCFQMNEAPVHDVCLSAFYIDTNEVTQGAYQSIIGKNPAYVKGDLLPVNQVNWTEASTYCQLAGKRLPTEAEWEYAARSGGQIQKWAGTSTEADLVNYAWYGANSLGTIHPVGMMLPNGLGLYDMSGNVWEWVNDWYSSTYYSVSPINDPQGPSTGSYRVLRGGSRVDSAYYTRAANRNYRDPGARLSNVGFRCAVTP